MDIQRLSAFAHEGKGGNPAGVVICEQMPSEAEMLRIAADVGYSETAFLQPQDEGWRVRYFAPETEVPFCGHATIASGAALGAGFGAGTYTLFLNDGTITVTASQDEAGNWRARLRSPQTRSQDAPSELVSVILDAFSLVGTDLDAALPPRLAFAGANHLILGLKDREILAAMNYPFEQVKSLMQTHELITIALIWEESPHCFHARNAFAVGGVVEDPATGAAAAAFAGYLRDIGRPDLGTIEIFQGFDMGMPSHLTVEFGPQAGERVDVSGSTRVIE